MTITLCNLLKIVSHNNYKIALRNIYDVYAFLEKLGDKLPQNLSWGQADEAIQKHYNLSKSGGYVFVNHNDSEMWNLLCNLKVLDITEDFIIVVGYERFHS